MIPDLRSAIEALYVVGARYARNRSDRACPCCVSPAQRALLHSRPLRELTDAEIGRYAFKALTTWGNEDDLKYFLPRILELLVQHELPISPRTVLGKLTLSRWMSWPRDEHAAVARFLEAWWLDTLSGTSGEAHEVLSAIDATGADLNECLDRWDALLSTSSAARARLLGLVDRLAWTRSLDAGVNAEVSDAVTRWLAHPDRRDAIERAILELSDGAQAREQLAALLARADGV